MNVVEAPTDPAELERLVVDGAGVPMFQGKVWDEDDEKAVDEIVADEFGRWWARLHVESTFPRTRQARLRAAREFIDYHKQTRRGAA